MCVRNNNTLTLTRDIVLLNAEVQNDSIDRGDNNMKEPVFTTFKFAGPTPDEINYLSNVLELFLSETEAVLNVCIKDNSSINLTSNKELNLQREHY